MIPVDSPRSRLLSDVHETVLTDHSSVWRRMFAFASPAYIISVGYMDPGNGYATFNESASFFGNKSAGMPDVWRDLQFGAKIDMPIKGLAGTITLSGLFVDLHQAPLGINLMLNGVSVTQPGKIGLFQAKYTKTLSSGVQVPISITYSNRTDLVKESTVQGDIGITFDYSKLVASKQASVASGQ